LDQWLKDLPEGAEALMRLAKDVLQEWPLGKVYQQCEKQCTGVAGVGLLTGGALGI